jgi:predicted nucleic acid-binding protein
MDNLICKWIRRGIVTHPEGDELRCQPIRLFPFRELLGYAFEIAGQTGCSLCDCLYLALAVSLKGKMATADRRWCERLDQTPFSKYAKFISDVV